MAAARQAYERRCKGLDSGAGERPNKREVATEAVRAAGKLHEAIGIGSQETIEIVDHDPVPNLPDLFHFGTWIAQNICDFVSSRANQALGTEPRSCLLVGSRSAELVTGPSPDTGSSKTKTETKGTAGAANGDVSGSPSAATKEQKAGSQVNVNVTTEQRTEIRNVIIENKVEPVRPTFSISVGTAVPRTVRLHKLPARVIQIVPQYRDYEYIVLADERIIIIDPATYEIVYVLTF